jgi:hypothetical protein
MVTCKKYNGSGLVKRIKPFICKFEHVENKKSLYIDCDVCKSSGDIKEDLQ